MKLPVSALAFACVFAMLSACSAPSGQASKPATSQTQRAAPAARPSLFDDEPARSSAKLSREDTQELVNEMAIPFLKAKLKKNSSYLFCDQTFYLGCYNIERAQCILEINAVKDECLAKADAKFTTLKDDADVEKYMSYFGACITIKHMMQHPNDDLQKISSCLQTGQFDYKQRDKSLMQ